MSLHSLFGRHSADLGTSHWQQGSFVSRCAVCDSATIKLPGLAWQLRAEAA